jgi:gamma-glutamyl phosphate reductase
MDDLISIAVAGRAASRKLALLTPADKNAALSAIAGALLAHSTDILTWTPPGRLAWPRRCRTGCA